MMEKILQIWKVRDLRNKILFVLGMLVIYRLAAHIPVPGVNPAALKDLFAGNQVLGLIKYFFWWRNAEFFNSYDGSRSIYHGLNYLSTFGNDCPKT